MVFYCPKVAQIRAYEMKETGPPSIAELEIARVINSHLQPNLVARPSAQSGDDTKYLQLFQISKIGASQISRLLQLESNYGQYYHNQ
jgi:hypothetical protein